MPQTTDGSFRRHCSDTSTATTTTTTVRVSSPSLSMPHRPTSGSGRLCVLSRSVVLMIIAIIIVISTVVTSVDVQANVGVTQQSSTTASLVPAMFVFGDSIVDPGNNNHFITLAKVDYFPYGIDFPGSVPSGRFSNGYNPADLIGFKLGLPLIPAYHNPATKGKRLLGGVNFASGGSGIHSYTGKLYGDVVSMDAQVKNYEEVKEKIIEMIGEIATNELLASAAHLVVTGSNDWLLSYYSPVLESPLQVVFSTEQFRDGLIEKLVSQLEGIYKVGARKIVVAGVPPLGCCPSQLLEHNSNGSCVEFLNDVCKDFNEHVIPQLMALNQKLLGAQIFYIDVYTPVLIGAQNPSQYGFKIGNHACCGIGKYGGFLTCLRGLHPCENVEDYMYWDAYHPTQNFYPHLIELVWNNGPPYSYPSALINCFNNMDTSKEVVHIEL